MSEFADPELFDNNAGMVVEEALLPHLASALNTLGGNWGIVDAQINYRGLAVTARLDPATDGHVHAHIGMALPNAETLWDCVKGLGSDREAAFANAAQLWGASTIPTLFELLRQDGSGTAERLRPRDNDSYPGWHTIRGPAIVFGLGVELPEGMWNLVDGWLKAARPFAAIAPAVDEFLGVGPHGIKLYVREDGDDLSTVEVDGVRRMAPSDILCGMPPIGLPAGVAARVYCLLLFRGSDHV